ncbi:MAG: class I tRNA ligase family protein, partial [Rhodospirillales bacterium]
SKSKGNVLDPLVLIDQYGADALRFTLTAFAAQGRDVKLSPGRIEGYRNFVTKLWNAARYAQMNGCAPAAGFDPGTVQEKVDRWIVGETAAAAARIQEAIEDYRFNEAAQAAYRFTWHTFCDWYLEFSKPILAEGSDAAKAEVRATTAWVLDMLLKLLHPIMPFVTEELWGALAEGARAKALVAETWPELDPGLVDPAAAAEMDWVVRLISGVRAIRSEMNVPPAAKLDLLLKDAAPETLARLATHRDLILRMARLERAEAAAGALPKGVAQMVLDEATVVLPLGAVIDIAQERARLQKEIDKAAKEIDAIDKKLGNANFVARAPEEVVEEQRERRDEHAAVRDRLAEALQRLAG